MLLFFGRPGIWNKNRKWNQNRDRKQTRNIIFWEKADHNQL